MTIAGALTASERELIGALIDAGVPSGAATLATTTLTRRFVRPEPELLDLVSNYPHLEDEDARVQAFAYMRRKDWLVDVDTVRGALPLVRASPQLAALLDQVVPRLAPVSSRIPSGDSVKVLGHMGETRVYDTFADTVAAARSEIVLPMIMTSPNMAIVELLEARADAGVTIRVLLATPGLAADIRGQSSHETAKMRLKVWRSHARRRRRLQVRVTGRRANLRDASSVMIDRRLLRYDVYDDESQRSTDGTMIEVDTTSASNLVRMYADRFDEVWRLSRPLGAWATVAWVLVRWWWVAAAAGAGIMVVVYQEQHPLAASLLAGAVVGYAVDHLDRIGKFFARWWARLRS